VAKGGLPGRKSSGKGHPLVEHKTLPLPTLLRLGNGIEVSQHAPIKLEHSLEALAAHPSSGLFTANTAGAKHGHGAISRRVQMLCDPGWEVRKGLGFWVQRLGKGAHGHLVIVSQIDHGDGGIIEYGVPGLRRYALGGAGVLQGVALKGDKVAASLDLEAPKGWLQGRGKAPQPVGASA
jgi:hypothetical protein